MHVKSKKGSQKKISASECNAVSGTPVSENNFQSRLLTAENSHSTPSQEVRVKDGRKQKPKKNKEYDDDMSS